MDDLSKKRTVCCKVVPVKSTENKIPEGQSGYHYKCPECGRDPVVCLITEE